MFDIVEGQPDGYVPDFFEKPPLVHRKGINQDPKKGILVLVICIIIYLIYGICILVSDMCIFRLGVYDIGRFIVYLVICIFLCWEWGRYIGCDIWDLYTWFVYTEIPRVFWALGILFIYLLCWERDTRSSGF